MHPLIYILLLSLAGTALLAQPSALPAPIIPEAAGHPMYQISAVLSPELLRKRGVSERRIERMRQGCHRYVGHFAHIARTEQEKFGIPASITLAQGLLESDAGRTHLAMEFRNHFGIKCFASVCAAAHCAPHPDDHPTDFFRTFGSNWESFRAHSLFLKKARYRACFALHPQDYRGWAYALQRAGYATDKRYAEKLILLIERLEIWRYD